MLEISLTPNQMLIYDQHKKNKDKNQKNSFRIEIPSFETLYFFSILYIYPSEFLTTIFKL